MQTDIIGRSLTKESLKALQKQEELIDTYEEKEGKRVKEEVCVLILW